MKEKNILKTSCRTIPKRMQSLANIHKACKALREDEEEEEALLCTREVCREKASKRDCGNCGNRKRN